MMMGMLQKFLGASSGVSSPQQWLIDWFHGSQSDSGINVTTDNAMTYPPVWYALSKISGHVGMLPLNLHRRSEAGTQLAATHPVYKLLRTRPNQFQTAAVFKENLMMHALLNGNGRAVIVRKRGVPHELIPLLPNCTYSCLVQGKKWHVVTCSDDDWCAQVPGGPGAFRDGKVYKFKDEDVLHVPGLGYNGYSGKSLVDIARDPIGLGLAAQTATSRSFRNGSKPGVVIEAPAGMLRDDADAKKFIDNFNDYHEGLDNAGKAALLREGMKLSTVAMSASDAQWIEQRQFQRIDVAMMFGLETLPGDSDSVSYNSLEQKNLAYLQNCLSKWLTKWEQECQWKLLSDIDQQDHYFNFDESELLRTDYKTKVETLSSAIAARIINPNEAREALSMNPYEGGEKYANPAITPGAEADDDPEGVEEPDDAMPMNANRRAVVAHLRHRIGVEAGHILRAAGNKPNYIGWVDWFYESRWAKTMENACENLGGDREVGRHHCEMSKHDILEVAGTVSADGLADAISELVSEWPSRAESMADIILGETANV